MFTFGINEAAQTGSSHAVDHQLYMGCRWCTLFTLILQLAGFDIVQRFDCSVRSVCFYCLDGKD